MDDELQKAKHAAYHYLSFRARSVKEVRDKLEEKDYPEEIVAQVIADLERQRFLDDCEFARRFVEARLARAPALLRAARHSPLRLARLRPPRPRARPRRRRSARPPSRARPRP